MTFAERLRELRQRAGMTQAELSAACGIPIGTLRDYEQGKRRNDPSLQITVRIATALRTDCRAFADCISEDGPAQPSPRGRPRKKK